MPLDNKVITCGKSGLIIVFDTVTKTQSVKTSGVTCDLYSIDGNDDGSEIWISGTNTPPGSTAIALRSLDYGETWESFDVPDCGYATKLVYISSNEVYVLSSYGRSIKKFNGLSFTRISGDVGWGGSGAFDGVSGTNLYVGADNPYSYYPWNGWLATWNGSTLSAADPTLPGSQWGWVKSVNDNEHYIWTICDGTHEYTAWAFIRHGYYGNWTLEYNGKSLNRISVGNPWYNSVTKELYFICYENGDSSGNAILVKRDADGIYTETSVPKMTGMSSGTMSPYVTHSGQKYFVINNPGYPNVGGYGYFDGTNWTYQTTDYLNDCWGPLTPGLIISGGGVDAPIHSDLFPGESCSPMIIDGDLAISDTGIIAKDYTAESRVYFRLMCRRGQCWYDPDLGSRLWTIRTLKDAQRKVKAYVDEALKPLVDDGTILSASIGEYYEDPTNGMLAVQIIITVPTENQQIDLGLIPLGGL